MFSKQDSKRHNNAVLFRSTKPQKMGTQAWSALPEGNEVIMKSQWRYQGSGTTKARFVTWGGHSDIDRGISQHRGTTKTDLEDVMTTATAIPPGAAH